MKVKVKVTTSVGVRSRLMEGRRMQSRRGRSTRKVFWTQVCRVQPTTISRAASHGHLLMHALLRVPVSVRVGERVRRTSCGPRAAWCASTDCGSAR